MNCIQTQGMITRFINDELNIKELEQFLDHVFICSDCMEEVEIYYTLLTAMKQLDEDKNLSGDFKNELRHKLEDAQERVFHAKYTYYRKKAILVLVMAVIAFMINFSYTSEIADTDKKVTDSDFHIRQPYESESYYRLDRQLQEYIRKTGAFALPTGPLNSDEDGKHIDVQSYNGDDEENMNVQTFNSDGEGYTDGEAEDGESALAEKEETALTEDGGLQDSQDAD